MADKTTPVGGDTAFQLLYKDQGAGAYARAVSSVTGTGNFLDVPLLGDTGFKIRYVEVSAGVYALALQGV